MRLYHEEQFGPIVPVATFDKVQEGNDFGLTRIQPLMDPLTHLLKSSNTPFNIPSNTL